MKIDLPDHYAGLEKNQLNMMLMSYSALNALHAHVSSPRGAMFTGNMGQYLAVSGATKRRLRSGMERKFRDSTISRKFDRDAEILKIIHRFPNQIGVDAIKFNPLTLAIYEDYHTKEVCCLEIPNYSCLHQHFGFEYKKKDIFYQLRPTMEIPKDTIVADSPLVQDDGEWAYGLEANVLFMSDPAVIEDGIKVSESFLKRIVPTGYEKRVIMFGANDFPINLYGNEEKYKPFPDIGEYIHSDGLLFALRDYDEIDGVVNMSRSGLCTTDYFYDNKVYAEPNARVVDIQVTCNTSLTTPPTPYGMEDQLNKYYKADEAYYQSILEVYEELCYRHGGKPNLNEKFQRLVVEAIHRVGVDYHPRTRSMEKLDKGKVSSVYRNVPIPHWRVEITYEYHSIPNIGFKLTGGHGNKGVICAKAKDEDMPIDAYGNRAEVIMDANSVVRRLNPAALYEQYINASGRDTVRRVKAALKITPDMDKRAKRQHLYGLPKALIQEQFMYLMGWYNIVAPNMVHVVQDLLDTDPDYWMNFVEAVCCQDGSFGELGKHLEDGLDVVFPPDNPVDRPLMIKLLAEQYPALMSPVTFTNAAGEKVTTKANMLIGSSYIMVLEKTAEDWSAVASAKLSHFGTTARLTNHDKHSAPGRQNVVKTIGEAESRHMAATVGGEFVGDLMDSTNNPRAHQFIQRAILDADKPTNIDRVLDRVAVPKGGHRALVFVKHMFECSGKKLTNK